MRSKRGRYAGSLSADERDGLMQAVMTIPLGDAIDKFQVAEGTAFKFYQLARKVSAA
jgi:hypothetical protein